MSSSIWFGLLFAINGVCEDFAERSRILIPRDAAPVWRTWTVAKEMRDHQKFLRIIDFGGTSDVTNVLLSRHSLEPFVWADKIVVPRTDGIIEFRLKTGAVIDQFALSNCVIFAAAPAVATNELCLLTFWGGTNKPSEQIRVVLLHRESESWHAANIGAVPFSGRLLPEENGVWVIGTERAERVYFKKRRP